MLIILSIPDTERLYFNEYFRSHNFPVYLLTMKDKQLNQSSRIWSKASWGLLRIQESVFAILDCYFFRGTRLLGGLTWHGSDEKWVTSLKTPHYLGFASGGKLWGHEYEAKTHFPKSWCCLHNKFKSVCDLWIKYSESYREPGRHNY